MDKMIYLELFIGAFFYIFSTYILSVVYTYSGDKISTFKRSSSFFHLILFSFFALFMNDFIFVGGLLGYLFILVYVIGISIMVSYYNKKEVIHKYMIYIMISLGVVFNIYLIDLSYMLLVNGVVQFILSFLLFTFINKILISKNKKILINNSEIYALSTVFIFFPFPVFVGALILLIVLYSPIKLIIFLNHKALVRKNPDRQAFKLRLSSMFMATCLLSSLSMPIYLRSDILFLNLF